MCLALGQPFLLPLRHQGVVVYHPIEVTRETLVQAPLGQTSLPSCPPRRAAGAILEEGQGRVLHPGRSPNTTMYLRLRPSPYLGCITAKVTFKLLEF